MNRIEELNQSLQDAWASDQKVKALKIVIQVRPGDLLCMLVLLSFRISCVKLLCEERGFSEAGLQVSPCSLRLLHLRALLGEPVIADVGAQGRHVLRTGCALHSFGTFPLDCRINDDAPWVLQFWFLGWSLTHSRLVQTKDGPTVWVSLTQFPLSL